MQLIIEIRESMIQGLRFKLFHQKVISSVDDRQTLYEWQLLCPTFVPSFNGIRLKVATPPTNISIFNYKFMSPQLTFSVTRTH